MTHRLVLAAFLSIGVVSLAQGAPTVSEWNVLDNSKWTVSFSGTRAIITITGTDTDTFCFEAYDDVSNAPIDIDSITVASGVGGTIRVSVLPDPSSARTEGADDVRVIDLANADVGELVSMDITGELGRIPLQVAGRVTVNAVTGTISVGANLNNTLNLGTVSGTISADTIASNCNLTVASLNSITATTGSSSGGNIVITDDLTGTLDINGPFNGMITVQGDIAATGRIVTGNLNGYILIDGDLIASGTTRIAVSNPSNESRHDAIRVTGDLTGSSAGAPAIVVTGILRNTIGIDGSLFNACTGDEITVGSLGQTSTGTIRYGSVTIDYAKVDDGSGVDEDQDWRTGATVKIGAATPVGSTTQIARVWEVTDCRGDMDNDGAVSTDDGVDVAVPPNPPNPTDGIGTGHFYTAQSSPDAYEAAFPGMYESRDWKVNCDADSTRNPTDDEGAFLMLQRWECCSGAMLPECPGDVNADMFVNLTDLATLLANFGTPSGATLSTGDLDGDGAVTLTDLAILLAHFGVDCCPSDPPPPPPSGGLTIAISGYDSGSYSGGDFTGEKTDFVFDVLATISTSADDWNGGGVNLTTSNGAKLRLVPSPGSTPVPGSTQPEKYSTFFSVPYAVNANSRFTSPFPTGGVAGKYAGGTGSYTYTDTAVDTSWYDMAVSSDGPAAIMRIVIDVTDVSGADTSSGFGSVYFSTSGPTNVTDIEVADITVKVTHAYADSGSSSVTGSFYVKG